MKILREWYGKANKLRIVRMICVVGGVISPFVAIYSEEAGKVLMALMLFLLVIAWLILSSYLNNLNKNHVEKRK